jgi:hypothetical protein
MCDNHATILITENPIVGKNMKHIEVKYHFIREAVQNKLLTLLPIPSSENIADALTKPILSESLT